MVFPPNVQVTATDSDSCSEVVVYLDVVTRATRIVGPQPQAAVVATNLKRHLRRLVEAQDAGDLAALAEAAAGARAVLDSVTVRFTAGDLPSSSRGGGA